MVRERGRGKIGHASLMNGEHKDLDKKNVEISRAFGYSVKGPFAPENLKRAYSYDVGGAKRQCFPWERR